MGTNILLDKLVTPDDKLLAKTLGDSFKYWKEIKDYVESQCGSVTEEWKYYGAKHGWGLKTLYKKRNLFFFSASDKSFNIAFVFGDKAVAAVAQSELPKKIIDELCNAKKYAEGRGIRFEAVKPADVKNIKKLIEIKIDN
jgi:hypothetical protein